MPTSKGAKRGLDISKSKLASGEAVEATATSGNILVDNCHNYAASQSTVAPNVEDMDDFPSLPATPLKSPASKKVMYDSGSNDPPTSNEIISHLSALINRRSDSLEIMVKENSSMVKENALKIEGLKKSIDFMHAEMKDVKKKVNDLERKVKRGEDQLDNHQLRLSNLERYSRRWNLKLHGAMETEKEDTRRKVIEICQSVLPEQKQKLPDVIDTVHRLGPRKQGNANPRGIIIQFTSRVSRDAVWKAAKTSSYLRENHLKFAEDLSQEDRSRRAKLWPLIDKARKEGKSAYFVGARGFINGTEVLPPS